jgi:hypothetical protein
MNEKIIENIEKIKKIIVETSNNNNNRYACSNYSSNPKKMMVCKKIVTLKWWLFEDNGLGLKKVIMDKIRTLFDTIPKDRQEKFIDGANTLKSMGKISDSELKYFINNSVRGKNQIYIDNKWQPINKLNTNYYDLAELLTDLIFMGGERAKPIIEKIIENPKNGLLSIKNYIPRLIDKYFDDPKILNNYTDNIKVTSEYGEIAEKKVIEVLKKMKFKILYEGGDGDMIDMKFGTDIIIDSPEYGKKTVQVKRNEGSWKRDSEYKYVDWVIISEPFTIYDNKTKEKIITYDK